MQPEFAIAMGASLIAASVTTAGILVVRRHAEWGRRNTTYFACFAAGVLISVPFLHIISTALKMNINAPVWLLAGYLSMYFLNRFITTYVCDKPGVGDYVIGLVPMLGIGFHSFIDGIVYHRRHCLFLGIFARTMAQFALLIMLTISPMQMLSGGNSPIENQPDWIQVVAWFLPSRYFMSFSQAVIYRGAGLDTVWPDFLATAVLGLVFFAGSLMLFRRSMSVES